MSGSLTDEEQQTARLFGDIHRLPDDAYMDAQRRTVVTAENLGVSDDFLSGKCALDAGTGGQGTDDRAGILRARFDLYV